MSRNLLSIASDFRPYGGVCYGRPKNKKLRPEGAAFLLSIE